MTFTAIDFETANYERTSACQIGIIVVKDDRVVEEFSSFIKPEPFYFIRRFTDDIHGIDKETVKDAPTFKELWVDISHYFEDAPYIVAHNSPFDMGVLKSCLDFYGIRANIPDDYCTVRRSRKHLSQLKNHKLSTVCDHFNIELNHHEALSDARAAALIAIELGE